MFLILKVGVNPEILNNIDFLKKNEKNREKIIILVNLGQAIKIPILSILRDEMLKLSENHVRTKFRRLVFSFFFLILGFLGKFLD